jgi:hypothetical protein
MDICKIARQVVSRHIQAVAQQAVITYMKLRDGSWGIRVLGFIPRPGDQLDVVKKGGGHKTETVDRVLWKGTDKATGLDLAFASIKQYSRSPLQRKDRPYECPECGEWVKPGTRCWETGMIH